MPLQRTTPYPYPRLKLATLFVMLMLPVLAIGRLQPSNAKSPFNFTWPAKKASDVEGDLILGGLMMVHERQDDITCGPIMPQGGIQVNTYIEENHHFCRVGFPI